MTPKDTVFISYAHADERRYGIHRQQFLYQLRRLVEPDRYQVWSDHSIHKGDIWDSEILHHIDRSAIAVLLMTENFLRSKYIIDKELKRLSEVGAELIPVLVEPCAWAKKLPHLEDIQWGYGPDGPGLRQYRGEVLRSRINDISREIVAKLHKITAAHAGIVHPPVEDDPTRGPEQIRPGLHTSTKLGPIDDAVPELPPELLVRDDILQRLIDELIGPNSGAIGMTGERSLIGLGGSGGTGKSVLAAALARDSFVRSHFPDGVFWVTVGEEADLVALQNGLFNRIARTIGDNPPDADFHDAATATTALTTQLKERRVLLIADDIWTLDAAEKFMVAGPLGRVVYTTRNDRHLTSVHARVVPIGVLAPSEQHELAARICRLPADVPLPGQAKAVLAATAPVALAVAMVAAAARATSWAEVAGHLGHYTSDDQVLAPDEQRFFDIFKVCEIGVSALSKEVRERYLSLVVFPRDISLRVEAVVRYWARAGLSATEVDRVLHLLAEQHLLESFSGSEVRIHDVQFDYLLMCSPHRAGFHEDLLHGYRELLNGPHPRWWQLPPEEPYIWENLVRHLLEAGRHDEALDVVTDPAHLARQVTRAGSQPVLADLARMATAEDAGHSRINNVSNWLLRHAHLLTGFESAQEMAPTVLAWIEAARLPVHVSRLDPLLPDRYLDLQHGMGPAPSGLRLRLSAGTGDVLSLSWARGGRTLAVGMRDWRIRIWDTATGDLRALPDKHLAPVCALALLSDGAQLVSADADGVLLVWNLRSATPGARRRRHDGAVHAMAVSPDERWIATACDDGFVRVLSVAGRSAPLKLDAGGPVHAVAFGPDNVVHCTGADGTVRAWTLTAGPPLTTHPCAARPVIVGGGPAGTIAVGPNGTVAVGVQRAIWLWPQEHEPRVLPAHRRSVTALAFSPTGDLLASGGADRTFRLWDPDGRRTAVQDCPDPVGALAWEPAGETPRLAVAVGGEVQVWDTSWLGPGGGNKARRTRVRDVACSPDGVLSAYACEDGVVRIAESITGTVIDGFAGHSGRVDAVAFSTDAQWIASAGEDAWIRIRRMSGDAVIDLDGTPSRQGAGRRAGWIRAVAFSPHGTTVASGGQDLEVRVWDLPTGRPLHLGQHHGWVRALAFNQDGRLLVSAGSDGTARMWSVPDRRLLAVFSQSPKSITAVAISPFGNVVVTADDESRVRAWRMSTDGSTELHHVTDLVGHRGRMTAVTFSPDGAMLLSVDDSGEIRLWNAATWRLESRLRLGPASRAAWGPSGIALVVDGAVVGLQARTARLPQED